MYEHVKQMADLQDDAVDDGIEVRILGDVWVGLDERFEDGSWNVQYLSGEPPTDVPPFKQALEIAGGMLCVSPETEVEEVRSRTVCRD